MRLLLILLSLLVVGCGAPDQAEAPADREGPDDYGSVDFRASCAPEVVEDFDRAVALLHHMMYQEARGAFEAIAQRDSGCAMAHWGVAMTLFQPLWPARPGLEDRERGWEAVQRAKEIGPDTDRERALLTAAEAFFQDPERDEWWPRIERWAGAVEAAHEERPDDIETAALYGLSLLAVGQTADDQLAHNARAAEVLAEIHERDPRHPGAIHYTIHADDATGRADEDLELVASYAEIAPSVPHALHMPSHIYVRLGDWPKVIEWNRRSAEAALEHPAGDRVSLHHVHALDYNLYGLLQQGDDAGAEAVLEDALSTGPYQEDFVAAFHLAVMPARYAVERRAWEEAARLQPREPDYLAWERYAWPQALSWFARGMGAVMTGEVAAASDAEARMRELRDGAEEAGERQFATYIEVDRLILDGRIAWAEGEEAAAMARMEEAVELERTVQKHPVTPGALLPAYEALGDLLRDLDRPGDALAAYEASLEVWPERFRSIQGAARAAAAAGEDEEARKYAAALLRLAGETSTRPEVREAEEMVAAP